MDPMVIKEQMIHHGDYTNEGYEWENTLNREDRKSEYSLPCRWFDPT